MLGRLRVETGLFRLSDSVINNSVSGEAVAVKASCCESTINF